MVETTPAELARVYQWPTTAARAALDDHVAAGLAVRTPAGYRTTAHPAAPPTSAADSKQD
jgi:hypothetical protein